MSKVSRLPASEVSSRAAPSGPPLAISAEQSTKGGTPKRNTRFLWEVDVLRGAAVVMMVIYHFVFNLSFLGVSDVVFSSPFWFYFQRVTASTFVLLVGVSLHLRALSLSAKYGRIPYGPFLRRGLTVFGWGLVLTAVTWLALGREQAIWFGILHFIGVAILVAYPFLRLGAANLAFGVSFLFLGKWLQTQTFDLPMAVWLGFEPADHTYLDFFPFIKWFGVVLLGLYVGQLLYGADGRRFALPNLSGWMPMRALRTLGIWSLPIYLVHQPLLLGMLFVWLAWMR